MSSRRTNLLAVLLVLASCCAAIALARLQTLRADAMAANEDLAQCRTDLDAIASSGGASRVASAAPSQAELDRILNDAASAAGTRLSGIEPGQSDRAPGGEWMETSIFLRLDALSLRQLVTFLHTLGERDPACRAKLIELSVPQGTESSPDAWAADVTIGYKSAAPHNNR